MSDESEILVKLSAIDNLTPVMVKALQAMQENSAKMAEALDKVSESSAKAAEHTEGLHGGLVSLEAGVELAEQGLELLHKGFEILYETMEKGIEASLEAEKANTRLTGSLISTGQYTAELNKEMNEYAETQQRANGVGVDTVKGILATGIQLGLSTEKAEQLVMASQKLAAATGTDVQTAFQKLQQSLAGHARGLAASVEGVKELSASQLKGGAAIDLVNQQLTAQFEIYQGSFAAGLARAHTGVEELYKSFGDLITQNPAVKSALGEFATVISQIGDWVGKNTGTMKDWISQGILMVIDAFEALNVVFDGLYRTGVIAFNGLDGALQTFALGIVAVVDGPFALLYKALSYLPGEKGKQFGAAADAIGEKMAEMSGNIEKSASNIDAAIAGPTKASQVLTDGILKLRDSVSGAIATEGAHKKSLEETNEAMSAQNAAAKNLQKTYDGFTYGTIAQREALERGVADRDQDLKQFNAYLNNKERLAISKAEEQQMAVEDIQAKALAGSGGSEDKSSQAQVSIDAEIKKQATLDILRQKGILSLNAYNQATLASDQRAAVAELQQTQALAIAKADALGDTPAGFQKRQILQNQVFALQMQQKKQHALQEGVTEKEINAALESENRAHLAQMQDDAVKNFEKQAEINTKLGDNFQAYLDRVKAAQATQGEVLGAMTATTNSSQYKAMGQAFSNMSSLMNTHNKAAFEVGKQMAVAGALTNAIAAGVAAFAPPPVGIGPLLGGILAGTVAVATGVQIANLESQQYNPGGQADEGMDSIPSSLDGKSFVVSGGERIVQPEANKKLTSFLDKQEPGNAAGSGQTIHINLNYTGNMAQNDVKKMADMLCKEIRDRSNRGVPIMSSKGLTT